MTTLRSINSWYYIGDGSKISFDYLFPEIKEFLKGTTNDGFIIGDVDISGGHVIISKKITGDAKWIVSPYIGLLLKLDSDNAILVRGIIPDQIIADDINGGSFAGWVLHHYVSAYTACDNVEVSYDKILAEK